MKIGYYISKLKLNWRRLFLLLLFIAGTALLIVCAVKKPEPAHLSWQVYSHREPVFRLHVVASSDTVEDQLLKEQVVGMVRRRLEHHGNLVSVGDYLGHVRQMLPSLEDEIGDYLEHFVPGQRVSLAITRSSFPLRAYGTRVFPPGQYLALKVVLGAGQGENWWCLLFPPLCVTLAAAEPEDEPVEPAGGVEPVPEEGETTDKGEPVRWRFKILEWLERWFAPSGDS